MPIDPRLQLAESLALALASIYLKPEQMNDVQRGQIALAALLASLELFRQATGRPEGWKPSLADWEKLAEDADARADAEQAKLDTLPPPASTDPVP